MTTLQPVKPPATKPMTDQGTLGDELVWSAAEVDHDLQTVAKGVHRLEVLALNAITGVVLTTLAMAMTLGPYLNGTPAVVTEIVAYYAATATAINAVFLTSTATRTRRLLKQTLATRTVEVQAEHFTITPLLANKPDK